eukprot:scaffold309755_cov27-Tisochrysis_lutea.AAC.1
MKGIKSASCVAVRVVTHSAGGLLGSDTMGAAREASPSGSWGAQAGGAAAKVLGSHGSPAASAARLASARRLRSIIAALEADIRRRLSSIAARCCSFSARRLTLPSRIRTCGTSCKIVACGSPAVWHRGLPSTARTVSCERLLRENKEESGSRLWSISSVEIADNAAMGSSA